MTLNDAHASVAKQVRSAKSSFYWPMLLQARSQRRALFAIYGYCRTLDDIADGSELKHVKLETLALWRERATKGFVSSSNASKDEPLLTALAAVVAQFELPCAPFLALVDGMEADVNGPIIGPSWSELEIYCAQVAGAVGQLCLHVWGWSGRHADAFAFATGEALQLTNILRDVKDDVSEGRLYLPKESLVAANLADQSPREVLNAENFNIALQPVFDRADQRFKEAHSLWPSTAANTLRPAWVMLSYYQALLQKVVDTGVGPGHKRARLTRLEKLRHLASAYITVP